MWKGVVSVCCLQSVTVFCLQRNKTLLVEYRQLRKANAFIDRRFGEDDESLTAEEKAIARFQKQRMKDLGGATLCALLRASITVSSKYQIPICSLGCR